MANHRRWLPTFILVLAYHFGAIQAPASPASQEWRVVQNNQTIYVSKTAVRVVNPDGFELLCSAPDWKATAFNREQKLYWSDEMKNFDSVMMLRPLARATYMTSKYNIKSMGTSERNGFRCKLFNAFGQNIYGSADIETAPEACEFLARYLYCADTKTVPLFILSASQKKNTDVKEVKKTATPWFQASNLDFGGDFVPKVQTSSIEKITYNASDFALPKGYKQVQDIKQVIISDKRKKELQSLLEDVGFTSDTTLNAKHK
jgi:hypothetical protein